MKFEYLTSNVNVLGPSHTSWSPTACGVYACTLLLLLKMFIIINLLYVCILNLILFVWMSEYLVPGAL